MYYFAWYELDTTMVSYIISKYLPIWLSGIQLYANIDTLSDWLNAEWLSYEKKENYFLNEVYLFDFSSILFLSIVFIFKYFEAWSPMAGLPVRRWRWAWAPWASSGASSPTPSPTPTSTRPTTRVPYTCSATVPTRSTLWRMSRGSPSRRSGPAPTPCQVRKENNLIIYN